MTKRNYGIDFLRILSTFMVVMLHTLGKGGILENAEVMSGKYYIAWFLEIASYCAVNCFALISGYVMFESETRFSKIAELWLQTAFYTVTSTVILFIILPETRSIPALLDAVFPITRRHYWYITSYFGMYIFIPLLNLAIKHSPQNVLKRILITTFILFCILPSLLLTDPYSLDWGYSMLWLCLLYLVGGYIHKYNIPDKVKQYHGWLLFAGAVTLTFFSKFVLEYISISFPKLANYCDILIDYDSPTIVLSGIGLLLACSKLSFPKYVNSIIAFSAPATLGIYLAHVNHAVWEYIIADFSRDFLNHTAITFVVLIFSSVIFVFLLCFAVEYFRIFLFKLLRIKKLCKFVEKSLS